MLNPNKCIAMKRCVLCLIYMLSCTQVFSQDLKDLRKVDSLLLSNKKTGIDTVKINNYQKICGIYDLYDNEKVSFYNTKIFELSKKANFKKGYAYYYLNLGQLMMQDDPKAAFKYINKAKSLFFTVKETHDYIWSVYLLSCIYMSTNEFKSGISILEKSLDLAIKKKEFYFTGNFYNTMGYGNYMVGNRIVAINQYKKALEYYAKSDHDDLKYSLYLNISDIYCELENYDRALESCEESAKQQVNEYIHHVIAQQKIKIYNKLGKYKEALLLSKEGITFFKQNPESLEYSVSVLNSAESYYHLKNYGEVLKKLDLISNDLKDTDLKIRAFTLASESYVKLQNLSLAQAYSNKALALIDAASVSLSTKATVFFCKYMVEKKIGLEKSALFYHEKYATTKDENNAAIKKDRLLELQTEFYVAEKENKIKGMQVANLQKSNQIEQQRRYLVYVVIGLVLALLGIVVFIKVYHAIKHKNNLIRIKNVALSVAHQEVVKSLTVKETLLKEIHHRVKNNLQLVMSLLHIQSKEKGKSMEDFLEISQSRIISMSLIHENLYQTDNLCKVDFKEYVNRLAQSNLASYNKLQKDIQMDIVVEDIYLDIQTAIPLGLIINELISNAYKHAFVNKNKGTILLSLKPKGSSFELVLEDNGTGITDNQATKKTLGLQLVKQLVDQIDGILKINGSRGMKYQIEFKNLTV